METAGLSCRYRLPRGTAAGGGAYPPVEGLDDMAIDWWLERAGRYRATPFTRVAAGPARVWMEAMTKVAGRR